MLRLAAIVAAAASETWTRLAGRRCRMYWYNKQGARAAAATTLQQSHATDPQESQQNGSVNLGSVLEERFGGWYTFECLELVHQPINVL